jgi:hypothetical protein
VSATAAFTRQRPDSTSSGETSVYGSGWLPSSSTSQMAWKTCIAWWVSRLGKTWVIVPRFR